MREQRGMNEIPVASRTQRRFERRQRLVMLILVAAVTVASFFLGIMVGERGRGPGSGGPADAAYQPAVQVAPPPLPSSQYTAPQKLTFYDDLPKGNAAPLGSGINLPKTSYVSPPPTAPPPAPTAAPTTAAAPPVPEQVQAQAQVPAAKPPAPAAKPPVPAVAAPPKVAPTGSFVIQVASTKDQAEAKRLVASLKAKGFAVATERADLGAKGIWYRVVAGPYGDQVAAEKAAAQLKKQKFSAMVRKR
jgi:cell division septation protein DedD